MSDKFFGNVRMLELEEEDPNEEIRKQELKSKATALIFDFSCSENVPLFDHLNFKTDVDGKRIMVATFSLVSDVVFLSAGSANHPVTVNGEALVTKEENPINMEDIIEFLGNKYLVNNMPALEEREARRIIGQQLLGKTMLGFKRQQEQKEKELRQVSNSRNELLGLIQTSKTQLKNAANKKQMMSAIIQKREELKKQYLMFRAEVESIEGKNLNAVINESNQKVLSLNQDIANREKELENLKLTIERREEMEAEKKKQMVDSVVPTLDSEEEELQKKLEEIKEKKKRLLTGS